MKAMDAGVQTISAGIGQAANGIKELRNNFNNGVGVIQGQVEKLISDLEDYSKDEASGTTGQGYRDKTEQAYNQALQSAQSANDTLQKAQETVDKAQKAYDEALKAQQNSADGQEERKAAAEDR